MPLLTPFAEKSSLLAAIVVVFSSIDGTALGGVCCATLSLFNWGGFNMFLNGSALRRFSKN